MEDEIGENGGKEVLDELGCVLGSLRLEMTRSQRRQDVLRELGDVGVGFCGEALFQRVGEGFGLRNVWLAGGLGGELISVEYTTSARTCYTS